MPNIPDTLLRKFQSILVSSSPVEYLALTPAEKELFEYYKTCITR